MLAGLTMAVSCLAGCSGGTDSSTAAPGATGLDGNSQVPADQVTLENNCYSANFPIAKDTVTLEIMVKDYSGLTDYSNMAINQWVKDNMNIELQWIIVPGGWEVNNQATLAYTSGDLPDIFMGMAPLGYDFHWEHIEVGDIWDLTPYLEKYAPNVIKLFQEVPQAEYLCRGYDGNIYMLPMARNYDNDTGRYASSLIINTTWLDNLGLDVPTTTTEFRDVLRLFKTGDPNGNGIADEIPLELDFDDNRVGLPNGAYGAFGMPVYYELTYVDDDGIVHYAPIEDNYRRCLTYYRDLYREGLVDPDWYNQDMATVRQKANGPVSTIGAFFGGAESHVSLERFVDEYAIIPPLSDDQGNCTWTCQYTESIWPEWFLVTKACEYPEVAVRFADYFYSVEGSYTALYGPPGEDKLWYVGEDNLVHFTESDDGRSIDERAYEYTPSYPMPHFRGKDFMAAQYKETDESKMTLREKVGRQNEQLMLEYYEPVMPTNPLNKTKSSLEDMLTSNMIQADINDLQYTSRKEFLLGTASIENEWDRYISNMKRFEVDTYIEIMQKSYDAYQAWLNG